MIENYLKILEDSLLKKIDVLNEITTYNKEQEKLLREEDVSLEELDINMSKKDELIKKLTELDDGFETLYERIREQLLNNKEMYRAQIVRLQDMISQVMEKSVSIQAQEVRNKKLIEMYFSKEKQQLRQGRQASKAAYDYYKSMNNTAIVPPQIMDQKK